MDLRNAQNATPLHSALKCWGTHTSDLIGRLTGIWVLIRAGADLTAGAYEGNESPIHLAMQTLQWMVEDGRDIPAKLVVNLQGLNWKDMVLIPHIGALI